MVKSKAERDAWRYYASSALNGLSARENFSSYLEMNIDIAKRAANMMIVKEIEKYGPFTEPLVIDDTELPE